LPETARAPTNPETDDSALPGEDLVGAWGDRFKKLDAEWQTHLDETARAGELAPGPKTTDG